MTDSQTDHGHKISPVTISVAVGIVGILVGPALELSQIATMTLALVPANLTVVFLS